MSDSTTGGTWAIGAPETISSTGLVTAVSPGTTTVTYTVGNCSTTSILTIEPVPAITGPTLVCMGSSITLGDIATGGTWYSSNTSVATINASSGVITPVNSGTTIIAYSLGGGCYDTTTITVLPLPGPISPPDSMCIGTTATLTDSVTGGTWTSSTSTVATIDYTTGFIHAVGPGTTTIIYTTVCGSVPSVITVVPMPGPITGDSILCAGSVTSLSDSLGGGTWSSSDTTVATVDTGIVYGVSGGTATITYTTACGFSTITITVYPPVAPITGDTGTCVGSTITLADSVAGGTWSSDSTAIATVGLTTGIVTGISAGTVTITYMLTATCYTTIIVTVYPLPATITGLTAICQSMTDTLTDATGGGTWTSSDTTVATIDSTTGVITTMGTGIATITYTLPTGCFVTALVTVFNIDGKCSPCTVFGTGSYSSLGVGGVITSGVYTGNYYLANNATVVGAVDLRNAVVSIASGVTIFVDPSSSLKISGSHLYSCSDM